VGLAAEVGPAVPAENAAVLAVVPVAVLAVVPVAVLGDAVNVALGRVARADLADPAVSVRSGRSDRNERRSG
jgi:hypothetical protein